MWDWFRGWRERRRSDVPEVQPPPRQFPPAEGPVLRLPRLLGTRQAVSDLAQAQLPDRLTGQVLEIHCARLASGSWDAADEIVRQALLRGVSFLVVVGAPPVFFDRLKRAAGERRAEGRVVDREESGVIMRTDWAGRTFALVKDDDGQWRQEELTPPG